MENYYGIDRLLKNVLQVGTGKKTFFDKKI